MGPGTAGSVTLAPSPTPPRTHAIGAGSTFLGGWGAAAEAPPRAQPQRPDGIAPPVSLAAGVRVGGPDARPWHRGNLLPNTKPRPRR